ncbi:uncharacterized protein [Apostichopus japonicus]|uniref:uncharacterized protein isoform X4 n=1 Tax=Stichopus japonicus TaxID=307972 RepID=UPI003AB4FDF7
MLNERNRRALGEKRSSVLRSASFSTTHGNRTYRPGRRGTLDNNTMKMADFHHQGIPEEADKVNLSSKQQYIQWEEQDLEKSKGNYSSGTNGNSSSGVNRRIKKQNSQSNLQRPKSWHNTGILHSYSSSMDGSTQVPSSSSRQSDNYVDDSGSPSIDAYTYELQQKSIEQFQQLAAPAEHDVSPGFVKRRAMNYGNPVNQSGGNYGPQPAIIYPQVVSAVQVQNNQAGRMPNGNVSSSSQQQVPGVGIANYSMVQMPQKQYASTADVLGEKKVPPPLPTRVDSKNRTLELSEQHHAKSSSWPATKPQATSTDTPTQSSVISPTSLPPVKLPRSQEQVYPHSWVKKPSGGTGRIAATVSSSSDFQLFSAQPVLIGEESTTFVEKWFQKRDEPVSSSPPATWHASTRHSPPSPPTRDIDVDRDKKGQRHQTSDSLYKDYEALLSEFDQQDNNMQTSRQDFTEVLTSVSTRENQTLSETVPIRTSPSFSSQKRQTDGQENQKRVQRKNSLNGESNERTWKNPNDFSVTAPAPLRSEAYHNNADYGMKEGDSEKTQPVAVSTHVRQKSELSITGNAPRNRTPINPLLMGALDLKGDQAESDRGSSNSARNSPNPSRNSPNPSRPSGNASRDQDTNSSQPLSSEDQRKLDQLSSGNSFLSMLQRDNQKMSFFGGEEFDRKNGPEVASDQVEPVMSPSSGHYRQGSYDPPSRRSLEPSQRHYLYSSRLSHSTTSLNSTMPEMRAKDTPSSNHARYNSFSGATGNEPPDVSMETKVPLEQGNQQARFSAEPTNVTESGGDYRQSRSDSDQTRKSSNTRRHRVSDPQLEGASNRSYMRPELLDTRLAKQRRSPQSSRSGSNTSSSSHESNRSFSGDHYSSTSSLASSRGYSDHFPGTHGRYSDVGIKGRESSPRSSPVDAASRQASHLSRSASMSVQIQLGNLHPRSPLPDKYGIPPEGRKRNKQPHVPERSHSMAVMDFKRKAAAANSEVNLPGSRGQEMTNEVRGIDTKYQVSHRTNTSPKSPVFKFPERPEIVRQENVETANASPMQVSNYTTVNEKKIGNPESPKESSKGGIQDDQLPTSPPLPPPPPDEEVKEIPGGADFPPPPPEFLVLKSAITAPIPRSDSKDREVISVQSVQPVAVDQSSYPVKVSSPVTARKVSSEDDLLNRSKSPVDHQKDSPVRDNRSLDNRDVVDEDSGTEKSSLEDREDNLSKEDTEEAEVNESDDPLVNRVLSFLSTSQTSHLRKLYPDQRKGKRKLSRPSSGKMPNVSSDEKDKYASRKDSLTPDEGPLSLSLTRYLHISPGRASLLNKARELQGSDVPCDGEDAEKLKNTKEELIERISRKVEELCNTQGEVKQEIQETEEIGRQLDGTIKQSCSAEIQKKYSTYIGDLEKVTKLLLNLSRKLTKVDSILHDLKEDNKENRDNLEKMKSNYASRYEDAKKLKESISQRHEDISSRLTEPLSPGEHEDFTYFVAVRCRLLIEAQDIEDKIQLGNEQIQALKTSLEDQTSKNNEAEESKDVNGNCNNEGHNSKPFPS